MIPPEKYQSNKLRREDSHQTFVEFAGDKMSTEPSDPEHEKPLEVAPPLALTVCANHTQHERLLTLLNIYVTRRSGQQDRGHTIYCRENKLSATAEAKSRNFQKRILQHQLIT